MLKSENIVLSIIVVTLKADEDNLRDLFESFRALDDERIELVLMNQSGKKISDGLKGLLKIEMLEHFTDDLPASDARNLGAKHARGEYIFFLDDDAQIFDGAKNLLALDNKCAFYAVQRGEMKNGNYVCHWPRNLKKIGMTNFPNIIIEWNIIVNKEIFEKLGGFPKIGPGQKHSALAGEGFVLIAKIISKRYKAGLINNIKICHPSLTSTNKSLRTIIGYQYGTGYSIGYCLPEFNFIEKVYWSARNLLACIRESLKENAFNISRMRMVGFLDGLRGDPPRPKEWLSDEAEKRLKGDRNND